MIPPSEACLYGYVNWSQAQAEQQSSMGSSQSFPSMRGSKARPQPGFHFMVQKRPVPGSSDASLAKRPHLESSIETHPSCKKSAGGSVSASSANTRRQGGCGVGAPDVSHSSASSSSSSAVFFRLLFFSFF